MSFLDGLVEAASDCNSAVITSPNMNFILQPVLSRVEVKTRADGRFEIEDPIQWPQFLSFKYSYFSCILRQPQNLQDRWKSIWSAPSSQDFIPTHGTIVSSLESLRDSFRDPLGVLVWEMSQKVREYQHRKVEEVTYLNFCETWMWTSFSCLSFPATYRDLLVQVINIQWYWLECDA